MKYIVVYSSQMKYTCFDDRQKKQVFRPMRGFWVKEMSNEKLDNFSSPSVRLVAVRSNKTHIIYLWRQHTVAIVCTPTILRPVAIAGLLYRSLMGKALPTLKWNCVLHGEQNKYP